jgi:uncharacterized membrane protein YbhN (UPF0104 family)
MDSDSKKLAWWIAGAGVSFLVLVFLFIRLDFSVVLDHVRKAWSFPLFLAFLISLLSNLLLSAWQWRGVYAEMGHPLPLLEHIFVKAAIYPLRAVIPMRGGDLGRPVYMSRVHRIPIAKSLSATALILAINISILLFFSFVGFLAAGEMVLSFICLLSLGSLLFGAAYVRLLLEEKKNEPAVSKKEEGWWEARIEETRWTARVSMEALLPIILLGIVTLFGQVVEFTLIATAMNVQLTLRTALGFVPVIILAGSLPISFMGLGVREAATILILASYGSVQKLMGVGLLFSLMDQVALAIIGVIALAPFMIACRTPDWPSKRES